MKTLKIAALAAVFATAGLTMQAQSFGHAYGDEHRSHDEFRDGRGYRTEARQRERNEAFMRSERFRLMRDGYLSPRDHAYLESLEHRQSFDMYRDSHDRF